MTEPKIIQMENLGYLENLVPVFREFCSYRKCEIYEWEDFYDLSEIGFGIICEDCVGDWVKDFIVRGWSC